jgi:hypothetical protein
LWLNDGAGNFTQDGQSLSGFSQAVVLADFDADNDPDVMFGRFGPNEVWRNGDSVPATATPTASPTATATPTIPPQETPTPIPADAVAWHRDRVDLEALNGRALSLALDENDYPRVTSYNFAQPEGLVYGFWDGVRWWHEVVEQGIAGRATSLLFDGAGRPHVAYEHEDAAQIKYAYRDGAGWQREQVDSLPDELGQDLSLALDGGETPFLAYLPLDGQLRLAQRIAPGQWDVTVVDSGVERSGDFSDLIIDENDHRHLAYPKRDSSFEDAELTYAVWRGTGWQQQRVVTHSLRIDALQMALDGDRDPHIAFNAGDQVYYAAWEGSGWISETVATADAADLALLVDDQDRPHLIFAADAPESGGMLLHAVRTASGWEMETLDGDAGRFVLDLDAAGDSNGRFHTLYERERDDGSYAGDVYYLHQAPHWDLVPVDLNPDVALPELSLDFDRPALSYQAGYADQLKLLRRDPGAWREEAITAVALPGAASSLRYDYDHPEKPDGASLAYYDSDAEHLAYATSQNGSVDVEIVDRGADVGQHNVLMPDGDLPIIAYWHGSAYQIRMAAKIQVSWQSFTNTLSPAPFVDSLDAAQTGDGPVYVSYHDASNGDLRLATWSLAGGWSGDVLVDGAAGNVGYPHSLEVDTGSGAILIAYYDQTNQAIKLARSDDGQNWQIETILADVGFVGSLHLELGLGQGERPRLAYSTLTPAALYFAAPEAGAWRLETILAPGTVSSIFDVTLQLGERPFVAYRLGGVGGGALLSVRAAPFDLQQAVPYVATSPGTDVDDDDADDTSWCEPDSLRLQSLPPPAVWPQAPAALPGGDFAVFDRMTDLFAATPGGGRYVDLYLTHAPEMGQLTLADPALLWDSYRTLRDFMPGLEALVTGDGDSIVVTQQMADDALDIWRRLAAAGSPALAQTINEELAASNDLQDFVGMTFDEWAEAIGVQPPQGGALFLPLVTR